MGPYNNIGSTPQAAPWAHPGMLLAFLGSCLGPYTNIGSPP